MKKILFAVLIAASIISCKKSNSNEDLAPVYADLELSFELEIAPSPGDQVTIGDGKDLTTYSGELKQGVNVVHFTTSKKEGVLELRFKNSDGINGHLDDLRFNLNY